MRRTRAVSAGAARRRRTIRRHRGAGFRQDLDLVLLLHVRPNLRLGRATPAQLRKREKKETLGESRRRRLQSPCGDRHTC